jgi:hypothetical protein
MCSLQKLSMFLSKKRKKSFDRNERDKALLLSRCQYKSLGKNINAELEHQKVATHLTQHSESSIRAY